MIEKTNKGKDLKKCLGILKNDKEYNEIMKEIKSYWIGGQEDILNEIYEEMLA